MFAPLQRQLTLGLTLHTFQPQHHLLRRLGFLVEYRFGLTTVPRLLAVVSAFALREEGGLVKRTALASPFRAQCPGRFHGRDEGGSVWTNLAGLVLCDFVLGMRLAVLVHVSIVGVKKDN